jgi:hypothetical protein
VVFPESARDVISTNVTTRNPADGYGAALRACGSRGDPVVQELKAVVIMQLGTRVVDAGGSSSR